MFVSFGCPLTNSDPSCRAIPNPHNNALHLRFDAVGMNDGSGVDDHCQLLHRDMATGVHEQIN
jgi:hypothetical protein